LTNKTSPTTTTPTIGFTPKSVPLASHTPSQPAAETIGHRISILSHSYPTVSSEGIGNEPNINRETIHINDKSEENVLESTTINFTGFICFSQPTINREQQQQPSMLMESASPEATSYCRSFPAHDK